MSRSKQRGVSAVLMVGVIVLMGGVLAYGATLTTGMNNSLARDIGSMRATQAAQAGLEWGRFQITQRVPLPLCAPVSNVVVPLSAGGMTVTVRCVLQAATTEDMAPAAVRAVTVFLVTSTACNLPVGGVCPNAGAVGGDYVESQATALVYR